MKILPLIFGFILLLVFYTLKLQLQTIHIGGALKEFFSERKLSEWHVYYLDYIRGKHIKKRFKVTQVWYMQQGITFKLSVVLVVIGANQRSKLGSLFQIDSFETTPLNFHRLVIKFINFTIPRVFVQEFFYCSSGDGVFLPSVKLGSYRCNYIIK